MKGATARAMGLLDIVTDFCPLFVILILILAQDSVLLTSARLTTAINDTLPECPSNKFKCFRDCCLKGGDWFCHERDERCYNCSTRRALCGEESLPRDCLLYCYKLQNPPPPSDAYHDGDCLHKDAFIAVTVLAVLLALWGILLPLAVSVYARRTPLKRWPICLRTALGLNNFGTDGNDNDPMTEEGARMLLTQDPNTGPGGPWTSHTRSSSSASSSPSAALGNQLADPEQLNLTSVEDAEDNGDERPQPPPPPAPTATMPPDEAPRFAPETREAPGRRRPSRDMDVNPEVLYKPDFSMVNPTTDMDQERRHVVAPGTDNPASNFLGYTSPDPHRQQAR
ncbi:uncharacterized protein LOC143280038 isoform X2 [Babylonia areolata]|uniref:uncharacterized protein LOC143280038 isoform X2 n=1 Tax=Babylonia areolata TaxID=304850 RepID=UPI003FD2CA83